jgi:hypothetical protein
MTTKALLASSSDVHLGLANNQGLLVFAVFRNLASILASISKRHLGIVNQYFNQVVFV